MTTIKCKKCGKEKPIADFYKSNQSSCKECVKEAARSHRKSNAEYYREYDRKRSVQPNRVEARQRYYEENKGKVWYKKRHVETNNHYRRVHPERANARQKVLRVIEKGIIVRLPCEVCGNPKSEAHHPDYSNPLKVMWLCKKPTILIILTPLRSCGYVRSIIWRSMYALRHSERRRFIMAYRCEINQSKECDGCGDCMPWPEVEDDPIQPDPEPPEPVEFSWDRIPDYWEGERL